MGVGFFNQIFHLHHNPPYSFNSFHSFPLIRRIKPNSLMAPLRRLFTFDQPAVCAVAIGMVF